MKKNRGLRIFVVCVLVGLGIGWWVTRHRRPVDDAGRKDAVAYADTLDDFDADETLPGAIAVDFADDVDPAYVDEVGRRLHVTFSPASSYVDHDRVYVAHVDPAAEQADLDALRADPRVEAAEEQIVYGVPEEAETSVIDEGEEALLDTTRPADGEKFPNDPRYGEQWHMHQIHVSETWPASRGDGVIVAVVDTGVTRVKDLAQTEMVPGWNFVNNSANTDDDHGHGTHVAGTIAQSTHNGIGVAGVAWGAKIMPMKVLSAQGSGTVTGIAEAIRWASDHGAKVINMSLGGRMGSSILGKAVKYAHDHGTTVVCAAGNDGQGRVSFPAAYPGAIAVAATQRDEATTFYSNWGRQIDVAAPGGNTRGEAGGGVLQNTLYQGKDDYFFFMGTSMASPHVAGVAALVVASGVTEPDAVEKVLKESARMPAGMKERPADYADHYGAGIVDAQAAVRRAQLGEGAAELGIAGVLGALVLSALRRRRLLAHFGALGVVGLVVGASGLFFLPQLGIHRFVGESLVTRGMPAWDGALFGAAAHGNPLFYSALLPLALGVVLYALRGTRGLLAGLCLGIAGHFVAQIVTGGVDVAWISHDTLWLVANAAVAGFIGYAVARK